ncbi:mannose/glucose-specific lectin-like isoform X2 [Rhododendron vialii]|uniref:mannose/glucose-specific lectin-like isoform X2 n=1 Tax=Rhododendron vialii TaxID=182163 RepID=UPI00265FE838|nr:mannose/glucose-specific lectin-like isoform X2 [Rhododendron vialii]
MQISICYGEAINSILFRSRSYDGHVIGSSKKIGDIGGETTRTFCIDSSEEQLLSISLTYEDFRGQVAITSLCFNTNLKKYGTFGTISGASNSVSIPIEGGVLVGFHGRGGTYLAAIGIFVAPKVNNLPSLEKVQDLDFAPTQLKGKIIGEEGWISLGPWGGEGAVDWAYKPDGPIMQITIRYRAVIDSILFESKSCDGVAIGSPVKVGGDGDGSIKTFFIDSSIEQLSSINLTYEDFDGQVAITSLCFNTNLNKYGPFGLRSGTSSVSIPIEGGVIAGFHGRIEKYLTAIGIFVAPKVNSLPSSDSFHPIQDQDSAPTHLKRKISDKDGWISLGPWGGEKGAPWAYKANGPIMQISVRYGKAINSILFESKSYDGVVMGCSKKIGNSGGHRTEMFCIDTSKEQLSFISVTYEVYRREMTIISLCFTTNLNKYGPFGLRSGAPSLSIPIEGGVITGFHGRAGKYLTAIGIFVAPKVNCLHSIQGPNSTPTKCKVLGSVVGSKPKTLENTIIHNAASSSATTNNDDHHGEAHNDLMLVESALREYVDRMVRQLKLACKKFKDLQNIGGSERDFDELSKVIAKLKFQIPFTTSKQDHQEDGALSPTSKMIHSDLLLVDTAFAEATESMYHMNLKIKEAHDKFKELQMLPSSERDSNELRKAIAKLKVRINSHNKSHNADSNLHHKNWDNINGAEDGMTHFFYNEPEVTHTSDFDGLLKAFHELPEPFRFCLLCFFKFPPMATIKRTLMIYLWIGQG